MSRNSDRTTWLDSFWEQADLDGSSEHPLERELCDRIDALARYNRQIGEAQANGWDQATEHLLEQCRREEEQVRRLTEEIQRFRGDAPAA